MLIYCKECEHECSDRAEACPNCGCPLKPAPFAIPASPPIRPRSSGKGWKLCLLAGLLMGFGGCAMCTIAVGGAAADIPDQDAVGRVAEFGAFLVMIGIGTSFVAVIVGIFSR